MLMINQSLIQSLSQAKKKKEAKQSFEVRTVSPSKKKSSNIVMVLMDRLLVIQNFKVRKKKSNI